MWNASHCVHLCHVNGEHEWRDCAGSSDSHPIHSELIGVLLFFFFDDVVLRGLTLNSFLCDRIRSSTRYAFCLRKRDAINWISSANSNASNARSCATHELLIAQWYIIQFHPHFFLPTVDCAPMVHYSLDEPISANCECALSAVRSCKRVHQFNAVSSDRKF